MGDTIRINTLTRAPEVRISVTLSDPAYGETEKFEALIRNTLATLDSRGVTVIVTNKSALTPFYSVQLKDFGKANSGEELKRMLEQSIIRDTAKPGYKLLSIEYGAGQGRLLRETVLTKY